MPPSFVDVDAPLPAGPDACSRAADVEAVRDLLSGDLRLVSVVGPPGIGKSWLARAVATAWRDGGRDVAICNLADARSRADVTAAVGLGLGLEEQPWSPEAIGSALHQRGSALLVLDDLERALPAAAELVAGWLGGARAARALVTSRETLRITMEVVHELGPLPRGEARALLLHRAGIGDGELAAMALDEQRALERAVDQLEGIPLAIEIAARSLLLLAPSELGARLGDRPEILDVASRSPARRASVEGELAASWARLSPEERRAIEEASVFCGGFTAAVAERVLSETEAPVLDLLHALRDKSLLRAQEGEEGAPLRFGMYGYVQRFAARELARRGGIEQARRRHAHHYATLAEAVIQADDDELAALTAERDNLRAVLAHADDDAAGHRAALLAAAALDVLSEGAGLPPGEAARLERALAALPAGTSKEQLNRAAEALFRSRAPDDDDSDGAALDAPSSAPPSRATELVIAADYTWFQVDHGPRVHLGRRAALRGLLGAICDHHATTPDAPIRVAALIAAGWPGQRILPGAARNRLHVALATLRALGLRCLLERCPGGYQLGSGVSVRREATSIDQHDVEDGGVRRRR